MARIKVPPRMAQPDLERQAFEPEAQAASSTINEHQVKNKQVSNDEANHEIEKPRIPQMATITGSDQAHISARSAAAEIVNIGRRIALRSVTCPTCLSQFPDMRIQEYREHVESCSRPITGDSESTFSSLSPPLESYLEDDEDDGDDGDYDSTDLDHLKPYVAGEYTSYPEINVDGVRNGDLENAEAQPRTAFRKLTDSRNFVKSLENMNHLPFGVLFSRVYNATEALNKWQNEWMKLDRFIEVTEPAGTTAKAHRNPRVPRETHIGIGYRDELESFVYGYEYQYHATKVGKQNPLKQRYTNGGNEGRELRQRVPTQKAVEADLSTSPETDEGIGTRRRGRGRKLREETADVDSAGGRGQRGRNNSQIDSQSRDQTPASTFPSGKKRGRPAKPKVGGASRLQELQQEEVFEYDSTPESQHDQNNTSFIENLGPLTRKRGYGLHETLETTENWQDDTERDDQASRPGTSDSTMTGLSDDIRNPPVRSSGRGRKRQNTSDFEDALPSHKRIRKTNYPTANGFSDLDQTQSTKDINNTEKARNTRSGRQEDDNLPRELVASEITFADSTSRSQDSRDARGSPGSKINSNMHTNQHGKERRIITLKTSNGIPRTSTNSSLVRNTVTDPLPGKSAEQDSKDEPKVSRASLNMRRRWAAKKQAEALGLPVPKIGRYPKGGVPISSFGISGAINHPIGGRKRKRDEKEPSPANIGVSGTVAVTVETPVIVKKRGGRPKKVTNLEPSNVEYAGEHNIPQGTRSNTSHSDKEEAKQEDPVVEVVPKRKGGRPRKKPMEIESPALEIQGGLEQTGFNTNESHVQGDDTEALVSPQEVGYGNENLSSSQSQLRRTARVRRQTSAALSASSQANTRRSSRSSQKSTVTPTPGPTQQVGDGAVIKQEAIAGPTLPKKRGRKPKSAVMEASLEVTAAAANTVEEEAPPLKRRRVGRAAHVTSTGSTPAASEEERATPQEETTVVRKSGPRKRKASVTDAHAPENSSGGTVISAESSVPRKIARKASITGIPATNAPSATPGSSVEPIVPKKRGGRPRKNANVSAVVADVPVEAEDVARLPEPLTTRARSSGQDNTAKASPAEENTLGKQATDPKPPKKKGNWGGKRVKGVFSSGLTTKSPIASRSDFNTSTIGTEQSHYKESGAPNADAQEVTDRGPFGGTRNKSAVTTGVAPPAEMGANIAESTTTSNTLSRTKRPISKGAALAGEVGNHDEDPESLPQSPPRPTRATTIADASAREANIPEEVQGIQPDAPVRPKRAASTSVAHKGEMTIHDTIQGASSNIPPRARRAALPPAGAEQDVGETGVDESVPEGSSRPKRATTSKAPPAEAPAADDSEISPTAIVETESIDIETNTKFEKKKRVWSGRHIMALRATEVAGDEDEDVSTKVESDDEESDSEATRKEKRALAAKASKALKNSQSMKARWANGSMYEVMRKKKEANIARKAAAARAAENNEEVEDTAVEPASAPASAPAKRKAAPTKVVTCGPKRRRTMNATMNGPADTDDEYDLPEASSSGPTSPTGHKTSEYVRYQQLSSPLRPAPGRRKRRPAALRASQSFSKFTDDGDDAEIADEGEEDVENELKKQFDSEYEHFRASTPPSHLGLQSSNILPGKRKPKPVINLAEAMRIEAGDEDDLFMDG